MTAAMKIAAALVGLTAISQALSAQVYTPAQSPTYYTAPPVAVVPTVPQLNPQQLQQLLSPIALYPDPLLGQVLAAATYPQDVINAAAWIQTYPNQPDDVISSQPWEPSVQALAHYPTVLQMMASNIDWTSSIGSAFLNQQPDVLNAIQQLRLSAQAAGNLANTAQQQVVVDSGTVDIVPVNNVVYVPSYDPAIVYTQPFVITYGPAYTIGPWLDIDFDWVHHGLFLGDRWDHRFDVHLDHAQEHPWVRDYQRPLPVRAPHPEIVIPQRSAARPGPDGRHGYTAIPAPGAFGQIQRPDDIQRDRDRGTIVQQPPRIRPVAPPPPPTIHPVAPPPSRPAAPGPQQVPNIGQRGAFEGGSRGPTQADSGRGHASMGHR